METAVIEKKEVKKELTGKEKRMLNLRPIQKGEIRNPRGRGNTPSFATEWKAYIRRLAKKEKTTPQELDDKISEISYKKMKAGDFRFIKDKNDRLYGQPTQAIEMSGPDGQPIPLEIGQLLKKYYD